MSLKIRAAGILFNESNISLPNPSLSHLSPISYPNFTHPSPIYHPSFTHLTPHSSSISRSLGLDLVLVLLGIFHFTLNIFCKYFPTKFDLPTPLLHDFPLFFQVDNNMRNSLKRRLAEVPPAQPVYWLNFLEGSNSDLNTGIPPLT